MGSSRPDDARRDAERAAAARRAEPAEMEADHLPQRVEAEAAGHHRVALEVAGEEPEVGLDVQLGLDAAQAGEVVGGTPEEFAAFIKGQTERWVPVIREAGIKAD